MAKAIISNRIYLDASNKELKKYLIEKLTYTIEKKKVKVGSRMLNPIEIIKSYKLINANVISIPQGRIDLIPEGTEIIDRRITNDVPFPMPVIPLRDSQRPVYEEIEDSAFINAPVGWGKTTTALMIAKKFGQKTLVVTHTTALRDQWVDSVHKVFSMDSGIIGSGKFDIDHAITIGNIQSLSKYQQQLSKEFGTIILDEAHHTPASTFNDFIDSSYARYRLALSGTMERADGKHILFKDFFGPKVFKPPQANTLNPIVKILPSGIRLPVGVTYNDKLNHLLYDEDYQNFIASIARIQISKGHKVLILANRVEFLKRIKDILGSDCILITGEVDDYEQRKSLLLSVEKGTNTCIAGSSQIFTEGISVDPLSTLIHATPTDNLTFLEQAIGRIQRPSEGKLIPEVIDINFSSPAEKKKDAARKAFYISKGWEVEHF